LGTKWLPAAYRWTGKRGSAKSARAGPDFVRHSVAERVPVSLLAALADLAKWLEAAQIPAVIIGGVASSFLGRPRLTQEIGIAASSGDSLAHEAAHFSAAVRAARPPGQRKSRLRTSDDQRRRSTR
jgi:hypothetical protein